MKVARGRLPSGGRWQAFTLPVQPAQYMTASMYERSTTSSSLGALASSGCRSDCSCAVEPNSCPVARTCGPPLSVTSVQTEKSPSGAYGAQRCHASTTVCASLQGHSAKNVATLPTGYVRSWNEVTMPKFPPPPPRQAQKRSAFSLLLQVRTLPAASTSLSESTLSDVVPVQA